MRRLFGLFIGIALAASTTYADVPVYRAIDLYALHGPLAQTFPAYGSVAAVDGQVVGLSTAPGGETRAVVWDRTGTPSDLTPPNLMTGYIYVYTTDGQQQVGSVSQHAALWAGGASTLVDLNPAGASDSVALGVHGGQQVGAVGSHAFLWNGSAASAVDLGPGVAFATDGVQQVGTASNIGGSPACLWTGSAASKVILSGDSVAYGVAHGEQVGAGPTVAASPHARLWHGTGESMVDLHPAQLGVVASEAWGTNGTTEVGWGDSRLNGDFIRHALAWHGSAASAVDLHLLLGEKFFFSEATSVDDAGNIYGIALESAGNPPGTLFGTWHAVEWVPVPEPSTAAGTALLIACTIRRRRESWG